MALVGLMALLLLVAYGFDDLKSHTPKDAMVLKIPMAQMALPAFMNDLLRAPML